MCVRVDGETRCDDWFWGRSARPRPLRAPWKTADSVGTIKFQLCVSVFVCVRIIKLKP